MTALRDLVVRLDAEWRERAACRGMDPNLFFPDRGTTFRQVARETCEACPVRTECLDDAVGNTERLGLWGGASPKQRRGLAIGTTQWLECTVCRKHFPRVRGVEGVRLACSWACRTARRTAAAREKKPA